ncbi:MULTISPECIES: glutamate synthase subunit beta [Streptomycetaceae]|uniref:Glutamate synthase, NADH/NADPH, small subunit n=1 Tax=Streptantibioticus cattleyicolor (strain ATCC 35852 / DSM 46488 / JCM 4925 / NBRC 14057 / NRRL 8057) TaxID=1003195 RepID=F8JZT7_STREN|nr:MULTISPECIES: glutamate synthase subunit beta [Streptomycetaceae]AEW93520.1 glutamate synthase, NADH/NADPH, small subunit [Streptantibioticus cattleyicolor NRRL 8057 = DSM 46488]MYS58229.1 glutamate synthase small subunit [Streptomyces sp. SID5468]CCB73871.1 glutamate synthase (small subunit) [Streptantibioticus cattleyicolor NRRL 8057 = DSM 46488]
MADPKGFLTTGREVARTRPVPERIKDWREVYVPGSLLPVIGKQAGRCMDCGIPFCHNGCPLGNLIPEWNDYAYRDDWRAAAERLHATNNFPEFTGRLCPAPCEAACVLGINQPPVTIKNVEVTIVDKAWDNGAVVPQPPERLSGKTVAVIGSGPAGLAAAQQLTRAGHTVAVYERADRIGGLLRYGIPEFKMEKRHINRRIEQMRAEGTKFRTGVEIGRDIDAAGLRRRYDAVVIAAGATTARDLPVPGRDLNGIHQAMEYLPLANKVQEGDYVTSPISAEGKHVVVIGGGDTGADCVGTAHRQGAASVTQLEIMPRPADERPAHQPWPTYPMTYKVTSAHEEGGERIYAVNTVEFEGDAEGNVQYLHLVEVEFTDGKFAPKPGTERRIPAQLVTLAMGFTGTDVRNGLVEQLGLELDARGNIARDKDFATNVDGVFVAGDAGRGQSLIVWAIAEGRSAARAVDHYLTGTSALPAPIRPTDRALAV